MAADQPETARRKPTVDEVRHRIVGRLRTEILDLHAVEAALEELGIPEEERAQYLRNFREQQRDRKETKEGKSYDI